MMRRTIICGDVHGCIRELDHLLDVLGLTSEDRLISSGDLIDKGPDSVGVVRRFREVGGILVLGNHEEKFLRYHNHERRISDFIRQNPGKTPPTNPIRHQPTHQMSDEDMEYLRSYKIWMPLPEFNSMVVHGGILPDTDTLPTSMGSSRERNLVGKLIRVRCLGREDGKMKSLTETQPGDLPWSDLYDGRFGHIYFGHDPRIGSEPWRFQNSTGLDTGCVFGGHLTSVVLVEGRDPEFVSVPAFEKYSKHLYEE